MMLELDSRGSLSLFACIYMYIFVLQVSLHCLLSLQVLCLAAVLLIPLTQRPLDLGKHQIKATFNGCFTCTCTCFANVGSAYLVQNGKDYVCCFEF